MYNFHFRFCLFLLSIAFCNFVTVSIAGKLRLSSFNLQAFGKNKAKNPHVVGLLTKIIKRYDLISLLELRDVDQNSINILLDSLNHNAKDRDDSYGYRISSRSGTTDMQEQIAYFYRLKTVNPIDVYSPNSKILERNPFFGLFESRENPKFKFLTMAVHLKPSNVLKEMNQLRGFYWDRIRAYHPEHPLSLAIIKGDLNADGSFLKESDWSSVNLLPPEYHYPIVSKTRTNVLGKRPCAYDRFVVYKDFMDVVVPNSAKPFYFDKEYARDLEKMNLKPNHISDHYPIEIEILLKDLKLKNLLSTQTEESSTSWLGNLFSFFSGGSGSDSDKKQNGNSRNSKAAGKKSIKEVSSTAKSQKARQSESGEKKPRPRKTTNDKSPPPKPSSPRRRPVARGNVNACVLNIGNTRGYSSVIKRDCGSDMEIDEVDVINNDSDDSDYIFDEEEGDADISDIGTDGEQRDEEQRRQLKKPIRRRMDPSYRPTTDSESD